MHKLTSCFLTSINLLTSQESYRSTITSLHQSKTSFRHFPFVTLLPSFHFRLPWAALVVRSDRIDSHHAAFQHSQVALRPAVCQELDVPLRLPQLVSRVAGEGDALDGGDAVQPQEAQLHHVFTWVVKLTRQKIQNNIYNIIYLYHDS